MNTEFDLSDIPCKCGCGQFLGIVSKATYYRVKGGYANAGWLKGHRLAGERNPNWNDRQTLSSGGYRMVWLPAHPNARGGGWVLEHRMVMSAHLGRPLTNEEVVHHRNGDKLDNRIDNLEVLTAATHRREHDPNTTRRVTRSPKRCAACGVSFVAGYGNHRRAKFCSTACRNAPGPAAIRRKLTLADEHQICSDTTTPTADLATRYSVSRTTIKRLRRGKPR